MARAKHKMVLCHEEAFNASQVAECANMAEARAAAIEQAQDGGAGRYVAVRVISDVLEPKVIEKWKV